LEERKKNCSRVAYLRKKTDVSVRGSALLMEQLREVDVFFQTKRGVSVF
jgi:hypothetical protein